MHLGEDAKGSHKRGQLHRCRACTTGAGPQRKRESCGLKDCRFFEKEFPDTETLVMEKGLYLEFSRYLMNLTVRWEKNGAR